ncbi:acyl-CoA-like ligand-binding transcription factor [Cytobacillus sp. Hm23]|uniref:acyl-CoA-like ligand-binding transcription factor n=1 Tax=Nanhaiella sioensis TaxID=3115293 RepID=UPI00397819D0
MTEHKKASLRDRKKAKTRAVIQHHALALFEQQGYANTTVEQIAEASEISPSTFFRYFPTKESVVLDDDYDPILIKAFQAQSKELTPIQAFRGAVNEGMSYIPEEGKEALQERMKLIMSVPELRAATLIHASGTAKLIAKLISERLGCDENDLAVTTLAGSIIGALFSVAYYCIQHPNVNVVDAIDQALAQLESGFK